MLNIETWTNFISTSNKTSVPFNKISILYLKFWNTFSVSLCPSLSLSHRVENWSFGATILNCFPYWKCEGDKVKEVEVFSFICSRKQLKMETERKGFTQERLEKLKFYEPRYCVLILFSFWSLWLLRFHHQRVPLVILVCGTASVGKSTIATQLAQRLNLPNVLQVSLSLLHIIIGNFLTFCFSCIMILSSYNASDRHGLRVTTHINRVCYFL